MEEVEPDSIRIAMDQAWRDHHHARDQTWKALQIEALLAAGLVSIDVQFGSASATLAAGVLVVIASASGVLISLHHRKLEVRKITHVWNCEEALGLHRSDLISNVSVPSEIRIWHVFYVCKMNTALFILRMHVAVIVFAIVFVLARCL